MSEKPVMLPRERAQHAKDRLTAVLLARHKLFGGDPRDQTPRINASMVSLNVQLSALTSLVIEKGVATLGEIEERVAALMEEAAADIETPPDRRPPGFAN